MSDKPSYPVIEPIKITEYEVKQSKYEIVPQSAMQKYIARTQWIR
jgi:hypothetical protein